MTVTSSQGFEGIVGRPGAILVHPKHHPSCLRILLRKFFGHVVPSCVMSKDFGNLPAVELDEKTSATWADEVWAQQVP